MYNLGWWDMFTNYGAVEYYLLYRMLERNGEEQNAGTKDGGTDSVSDKFE